MDQSDIYYKKNIYKSGGEKKVEKVYNEFLKLFITKLGIKSTYDYQLNKVCKLIFGSLFKGVYPMNKMPMLKDNECCIANTGLHWVACYMDSDTLVIYDSFGRPWKELFNNNLDKYKKVVNTENDAEQAKAAETCGPRCISWLSVVYSLGINQAMLL